MKHLLPFCLALVLSGALSATARGDFLYITNADGVSATITGYTGAGGTLVIPGAINGLRVTCIGGWAFRGDTRVTGVVIPDSVTSIGEEAFSAVDSPGSSITNLVIGNGVTTIGRGAFHFCGKLTSIRIPRNVTSIGTMAFGGCFKLESIDVDPENPAYRSVDGILLNQNQTELVQYPPGKTGNYIIPATVTNIADMAMWNCPGLAGVMIPEGVTTIKQEAFAACYNLTNVSIPASVTNIDLWAFDSCVGLKAVYFHGNAPGHREYHGYHGVDIYHAFNPDSPATVYYVQGTTGWGKTFDGRPTALWTP